jgi:hypothetical protein
MTTPMFPARFELIGDDGVAISIALNADGTFSGDGDAFLKAVSEMESDGDDPLDSLMLWLLVRAIRGR